MYFGHHILVWILTAIIPLFVHEVLDCNHGFANLSVCYANNALYDFFRETLDNASK